MAQFRQSGGERASGRVNGSNGAEQISSLSVRSAYKQGRIRRSGRSDTCRKVFVGASVLFISMILIATVFFLNLLSDDKAYNNDNYQHDGKNNSQASLSSQSRRKVFRVLKFGKGSFALGRDSRYWDKDDRRRDGRYTESSAAKVGDHDGMKGRNGRSGSKQFPSGDAIGESNNKQGDNRRSRGLYNEAGRDELKHYEAEYEASMKHSEKLIGKNEQHGVSHTANDSQTEHLDFESEFDGDDGLDYHDAPMKNSGITRHDDLGNSDNHIGPFRNSSFLSKSKVTGEIFSKTLKKSSFLLPETIASQKSESKSDNTIDRRSTKTSLPDKKLDLRKGIRRHKFSGLSCEIKFANYSAQLVEPLENRKFSRFTLQYTEVENRPNASEGWEPRFCGHQSLQEREESFYAHDQMINCGFVRSSNESLSTGFDLAEDDVRFMSSCHIVVSSCIFGNSDRLRTPTNKVSRFSRKNVCFVMFMEESTLQMLSSEGQKPDRMGFIGLWKIVVVKNLPYTDMRRVGKIPKLLAHRLFPSARYSIWLDSKLRLQSDPLLILEYFLWRRGYEYAISNHYDRHCVWEEVMQNKRLNKYNHSIIDQQFKFYQADGLKRFDQSDPKKLLPSCMNPIERYFHMKNYGGLGPVNFLPATSPDAICKVLMARCLINISIFGPAQYVPEGSFIVRAHTPMSNLFSCLWFNEVDRFTPRDQLSFGYTYLKLRRMNPGKPFYLNMFKDCERRSIVKLFHHRAEEKRNVPLQSMR